MKIICDKCEKKFEVEANPLANEENYVVGRTKRYRERLCPKCWRESRRADLCLNVDIMNLSKTAKKLVDQRNKEIIRLNKIIENQVQEIIRINDKLRMR